MIHVIPNLRFNGNCARAVELYKKAYGACVKVLLSYADANPEDFISNDENQKDLIYHCELTIGDNRLMLNDTAEDGYQAGNSLSLLVHFDSEDELRAAYVIMSENAVSAGPIEKLTYCACFASLTDVYGVRWELMAG